MATELRKLYSQLCPIPTEAPWSIGSNERSHSFLHRAINKLLSDPTYQVGRCCEKLRGDVEIAWNMTPHTHDITPHFLRFGTMPRAVGELEDRSTFQQQVTLKEIAMVEAASARASRVISRALDPYHRNMIRFCNFTINQRVWFHRRGHGWRVGTVNALNSPSIMVEFDGKFFPTHEHRIRPYFGELPPPPPELCDIEELDLTLEKPQIDIQPREPQSSSASPTRIPISRLVNGTFVVYELTASGPELNAHGILSVPLSSCTILNIQLSPECIIDSSTVTLTQAKLFGPMDAMSDEQRKEFDIAKKGEITFLLSKAVEIVQRTQMPRSCELQKLKWILSVKTSTNTGKVRYRARLVSAAHRSHLRNSVHGNAPTVALSTVRIVYSIVPSWMNERKDPIHIMTRDVTKAYLQSNKSERLIFYAPPKEFFTTYPGNDDSIWKANIQVYGEVETGLYWNKTIVPWLLQNFPDTRQSPWDPSMLYSPTSNIVILLCTDDLNGVIPESFVEQEAKIIQRFECRNLEYAPTEFKGIDIKIDGANVVLSQEAYVTTLDPCHDSGNPSKNELNRPMTDEELSKHRQVAGKLAWIATGTSPLSAFSASSALQGKERPLKLLHETQLRLNQAKELNLARLTSIPLDLETASIRVYSDGSYQNLPDKHSQIGFIMVIADGKDRMNIFHWYSARAPRRAHSTEEAELMALDIALRTLRNMRQIVFHMMKREIPVVCYVDNQALWDNLMNETAASIPDIMARCRSYIHDGTVASVCLISRSMNPADCMTKRKPNAMMNQILKLNVCRTPPRKVFMLQTSPFRSATFIPTSSVPMVDDYDDTECNTHTTDRNLSSAVDSRADRGKMHAEDSGRNDTRPSGG